MTERPDNTRLHDWLDETVGQTPNPVEGTQQVMSQVEETSQVGRWLPFPLLHRKSKTKAPTATDKTQYQPSPIPATNGHTPTVTGRTTSMLNPAKAITAGAIAFAIGGVLLVAQPFDEQGGVPGAEVDEPTTEPIAPVVVSGWATPRGDVTQEPTDAEVDGVRQSRGFVREGDELAMDDPRLTGMTSTSWNTDLRTVGDVDAALVVVSKRIENEQGSWNGSCAPSLFYTNVQPSDDSPFIETCLLIGADAFEGLSAYLVTETTGTPNSPVEGLIFEGGLPPTPEIPSSE